MVPSLLLALPVYHNIDQPYNAYKAHTEDEEDEDEGPTEVDLLTQIRDSLAKT